LGYVRNGMIYLFYAVLAGLGYLLYYLFYWRIRLGILHFNYDVNYSLNKKLTELLEIGVKSVEFIDYGYRIKVVFNNDIEMVGWDENKYFAWLNTGHFKGPNGTWRWRDSRPTVKTMVRLRDAINNIPIVL
jgi:hypothetical protein